MKKYSVCVYALCRNHASVAARWMQSVCTADAVYVLDLGSADGTVPILRACGATVVSEPITPFRFDTARNRALESLPPSVDICVCADLCDIFRDGWRDAVESVWSPTVQRVRYRFQDLANHTVGVEDRIHARRGFCWVDPVYEMLQGNDAGTVTLDAILFDRHGADDIARIPRLPLLEAAVRMQPENTHLLHCLGREYMRTGDDEAAIRTLRRCLALPCAVWSRERCACMRILARCYARLGNIAEAERWHLRACAETPEMRSPWLDAAQFYCRTGAWSAVTACAQRALHIPCEGSTDSDAAAYALLSTARGK